ncbi:MAG: adenylate/guanylate cyclase domain-containing protein [Anaerolineales bacterium]
MPNLVDALLPYVPILITSQISKSSKFPEKPDIENFKAVALFADISGFTSITEQLVAQGPHGVEMLSRILNEYFGKLTSQIGEYGGDVINFAGDSLLAIWKNEDNTEQVAIIESVLQCAHRIQQSLYGFETGISTKLSLRIGVGTGETRAFYLGGVEDSWEFIVTGESVEQAQSAEKIASPGEVIIAPKVWNVVKDISGYQVNAQDGKNQLIKIPGKIAPKPIYQPTLSEASEKSLQSFVPLPIMTRLIAGQVEWLAELRRMTILFINLQNFNSSTSIEHAGQVIHAIQETAFRYEGLLNKIGMDEKGASPLVIFGAPPFAHEDDPFRAVMAAQEVSKKLTALGQPHSIGITTGRVFCGAIGGTQCREFAIIGNAINTAARLMQAASLGSILCDSATQQVTSVRLKFSSSEQIQLKGKSEAISVFRPLGDGDSFHRENHSNSFVGRSYEKKLLYEALTQVSTEKTKRAIILEGEAGIGKSRLLEYAQMVATELGALCFICEADAVEKNTSYFAWRGVFRQLLGLEEANTWSERKNQVLAHLPIKWHERASLLNPILGLDFDEPSFISDMSGEVRAENIRTMLMDLLLETSKPIAITIEDAHWQDSASWALTLEVIRLNAPLFLLITTRPIGEPMPSHYRSLLSNDEVQYLAVGPLSPEESLQMVKQRLNVDNLPEDMANLIRTKAEGNPFFSEELAYSLRDSKLITMENNTCRIMPGVDLKTFSFPDTVQGVVTSRIDRLSPQEQLCVKVASVIGRIFTYHLLHDIHPIQNDRQYLQSYLSELERLDLTPLESPNPELTYIFKHAITQDVAYNLMLFAQRQELHKAIAEWYEQKYKEDLSPLYPTLAHHSQYSGNHEKALYYLELATKQALGNFANREAVDFLNLILKFEAQSSMQDNFRKAHWELQLGQAYKGLSDMETSRIHLLNALKLMGHSAPKNQIGWVFDLLGQLLRRIIFPIRQIDSTSGEAEKIKEIILIYETLSEIYYYAIDLPPFLACLLHLLNLVDKLGLSSEMARAYSVTSLVAGLIPLHGIAKRYEKRSLEIINKLGQFEGLAYAMSGLSLYNMGVGNFKQALNNMTRAVDSVTFLNNRPRMAEVYTTTAQVYQRLGKFQDSFEYFDRAYQTGVREENPQHQVWGLNGKAGILLYQGEKNHAQEAITLLKQSIPLLEGSTDHTEDIRAYGMLGIAYLRLEQIDLARQSADKGMHFISTTSPTAHDALEGYAGVTETYLQLLESNPDNKELSKLTEKALKSLLKCGQLFPIVMPRYWCYKGWYAILAGKRSNAEIYWQKGLEAAKNLEMEYEEARLLAERGRHNQSPRGTENLIFAIELFEKLEAKYDSEFAKSNLNHLSKAA